MPTVRLIGNPDGHHDERLNDDGGARWLDAMRQNDFAAAWGISDAILAGRNRAERDDPRLPYHLRWVWDGTPPDGRRVLVRCYHGLGDTLQFCRFLPVLARRAGHLTVEAQPELLPLLRRLPGIHRWVPFDPAHPTPPEEVDIEVMELAHALRCTPDAAGAVPYLPVPDAAGCRAELGAELGAGLDTGLATGLNTGRDGARLLGLCWQAGGWDPSRSLPLLLLRRALDGTGWCPVLLQRGPAAEEALGPDAPPFLNPLDRSLDTARTAALLAACDLVVTVDTMVAHLAGALARPTALLLRRNADWRWLGDGNRSRWYPTVTLFRQEQEGDWSAPLAALRVRLLRS